MPEQRVRIEHLDQPTIAALAVGDLETARELTDAPLTAWLASDDCRRTWQYRVQQLLDTPSDQPWVTGVVLDVPDGAVVGQAGFHGAPDETGMVEVGYKIHPDLRRRGYARATLQVLLERARREPDVRVLRATISPDNEASLALVESFGLLRNGEQWDEEDGLEWIFEIDA